MSSLIRLYCFSRLLRVFSRVGRVLSRWTVSLSRSVWVARAALKWSLVTFSRDSSMERFCWTSSCCFKMDWMLYQVAETLYTRSSLLLRICNSLRLTATLAAFRAMSEEALKRVWFNCKPSDLLWGVLSDVALYLPAGPPKTAVGINCFCSWK